MIYNAAAILGAACLTVAGWLVHPALAWAAAGAFLTAIAIGGTKLKRETKGKADDR